MPSLKEPDVDRMTAQIAEAEALGHRLLAERAQEAVEDVKHAVAVARDLGQSTANDLILRARVAGVLDFDLPAYQDGKTPVFAVQIRCWSGWGDKDVVTVRDLDPGTYRCLVFILPR